MLTREETLHRYNWIVGTPLIGGLVLDLLCVAAAYLAPGLARGLVPLMIVGAILFVVSILLMPGYIAIIRAHPSASAIVVCGLLGAILLVPWLVALVWAFTGNAEDNWARRYRAHYGRGTASYDPVLPEWHR